MGCSIDSAASWGSIVEMKRCTKCGVSKSLDQFPRMRSSSDGRYPSCKVCKAAQMREKRLEDPELIRAQRRASHARLRERVNAERRANRAADGDRVRELDRARHQRDRDKRLALARARYYEDLEESRRRAREAARKQSKKDVNARSRAYRERHPEKARWLSRRRMLRLTKLGGDYAQILDHDPCSYCGSSCEEIDHIDSRRYGGDGEWANLTAACQFCNRSKGPESLLRFLLRKNCG